MSKLVSIGLSGGVDSSVAAYILKEQGYDVTGVNMLLCGNESNLAENVANKLGIKFQRLDCRDIFEKNVIRNFVETYEKAQTPNPCVECNRKIKFDLLCDGDNMIATGHYAIVEFLDGRWMLRKSTNLQKDQSYFLYTLSQDMLSRIIFPLGNMDKNNVRKIAMEEGLDNANKKDSQDICFVPDGDYVKFIKEKFHKTYSPGNFVDTNGNVLGRHKGLINYTIGQRKGLGLALKSPMYVCELNAEKNEVVLSEETVLFKKELIADNFNWLSIEKPDKEFRAMGRIRYRHQEAACTVTPLPNGSVSVVFDEPQRAITAGQSLVLYDEKSATYVLGGGIIK